MIGVIGKTKVIIIGAFVLFICVLAFITYRYLIPETVKITRDSSRINGEVSKMRGDLSAITLSLEELMARQGEYEKIKSSSFINDQDRRLARQVLSDVQTESGVVFAKATVGSIQEIENAEAEKAGYRVIESAISVDIDSFDDVDFYEYIFLLKNELPGYVKINELVLKRERNLSGTLLRQIASGENPKMVSAKINATWTSLAPKVDEEEWQP